MGSLKNIILTQGADDNAGFLHVLYFLTAWPSLSIFATYNTRSNIVLELVSNIVASLPNLLAFNLAISYQPCARRWNPSFSGAVETPTNVRIEVVELARCGHAFLSGWCGAKACVPRLSRGRECLPSLYRPLDWCGRT